MDQFHRIDLTDRERFQTLHDAGQSKASDYSFTNMFGWADHYGLEWRFTDTLCWIRQTKPDLHYWAPVGDWNAVDWAAVPELQEYGVFSRVPDELAALWEAALPGKVTITEARGLWDYLYKAEELATLPGNRFHKKKNLYNQFLKLYPDYSYSPIDLDCVEAVLQMQAEWCEWHECKNSAALRAENKAIARILRNWDRIPGLNGGAIRLDGKVVAYTVGEKLTDDTLVVHFEKGTTSYKGIYQAINRLFAEAEKGEYTYFNREQDMDDEGLRKAKESYNPCEYIKKCSVTIVS